MKFEVLDVSFKSISEFFEILGYTCIQAKSYVLKRYGSYEGMIATRLRIPVDDRDAIRKKLLELKSKYENRESGQSGADSAFKSATMQPNALGQTIDLYTLSCLRSAWKALDATQRELILDATATATGIDKTLLNQQVSKVVWGDDSQT